MQETWIQSLSQEDPLENEMVTHSNILAWRIPWTEEPGGWQTVQGVTKSQTWLSNYSFICRLILYFIISYLKCTCCFWKCHILFHFKSLYFLLTLLNFFSPGYLFCSCYSVAQSCPTLRPHGFQHARLPCPLPSSEVCSYSYLLSQWCHLTISASVTPFSSCLQSFPALGSFQMSWLFRSGGQSIGASASASALPMNIQGWFPLGLTGWISLLSKGLSRVFPSTIVWKHQFFGAQPSLCSNFHIQSWLLDSP